MKSGSIANIVTEMRAYDSGSEIKIDHTLISF